MLKLNLVTMKKEDRHCYDVERRQTLLRGRKRTDLVKLEKEDRMLIQRRKKIGLVTMKKENRPC